MDGSHLALSFIWDVWPSAPWWSGDALAIADPPSLSQLVISHQIPRMAYCVSVQERQCLCVRVCVYVQSCTSKSVCVCLALQVSEQDEFECRS